MTLITTHHMDQLTDNKSITNGTNTGGRGHSHTLVCTSVVYTITIFPRVVKMGVRTLFELSGEGEGGGG